MFNYEEQQKRELKVIADFKELIAAKLGGPPGGGADGAGAAGSGAGGAADDGRDSD